MYFLPGYARMIGVIVSILYVSAGLKKAKLQENFLRFIVPNGYWCLSRKQRKAGYLHDTDIELDWRRVDRRDLQLPWTCADIVKLTFLFAPSSVEFIHAFDRFEITVERMFEQRSFAQHFGNFDRIINIRDNTHTASSENVDGTFECSAVIGFFVDFRFIQLNIVIELSIFTLLINGLGECGNVLIVQFELFFDETTFIRWLKEMFDTVDDRFRGYFHRIPNEEQTQSTWILSDLPEFFL